MPLIESLIGPFASIIDKVIPDKDARARAKLELLALEGTQDLKQIEARLSAIVAEAQSADPWTSRARPSFLYVMYALILFSMPMGVLAAFDPQAAHAIGEGMTRYLAALPEALYALFGTGYLGYTAARQWGKVKGRGSVGLAERAFSARVGFLAPGQAPFDFRLETEAQESSDQNDSRQNGNAFHCRFDGDRVDDVGRDEEFEPQQDGPAEARSQFLYGLVAVEPADQPVNEQGQCGEAADRNDGDPGQLDDPGGVIGNFDRESV